MRLRPCWLLILHKITENVYVFIFIYIYVYILFLCVCACVCVCVCVCVCACVCVRACVFVCVYLQFIFCVYIMVDQFFHFFSWFWNGFEMFYLISYRVWISWCFDVRKTLLTLWNNKIKNTNQLRCEQTELVKHFLKSTCFENDPKGLYWYSICFQGKFIAVRIIPPNPAARNFLVLLYYLRLLVLLHKEFITEPKHPLCSPPLFVSFSIWQHTLECVLERIFLCN